mmetsp:Transcript_9477/g.13112  ORF Transcript_9477/g.13112 Transcript_9477/m.13112 type:complete len:95 (+) Transcript_9477:108-392(+)
MTTHPKKRARNSSDDNADHSTRQSKKVKVNKDGQVERTAKTRVVSTNVVEVTKIKDEIMVKEAVDVKSNNFSFSFTFSFNFSFSFDFDFLSENY